MERLEPDRSTDTWTFPDSAAGTEEGRRSQCLLAFHRGEFSFAAKCLEHDLENRGQDEEGLLWLGLSYLRAGESENCLEALLGEDAHRPSHTRICVLPVENPHQDGQLARKAAATFLRLLDEHDAEDPLYRWLLTFSAMSAGEPRDSVPERYRIDNDFLGRWVGDGATRARQGHADLTFVDRARDLGVATNDTGRGIAVEDFDGDGDLDLVTGGSFEVLRHYRNEGGRFVEVGRVAGLDEVRQPFAISAGDFDGDGAVDLFVGRPFDHYRLFRNRGDGTFEDRTRETALLGAEEEDLLAATWTATWSDFDRDGDLDLFLSQWGMRLPFVAGILARDRMDSRLFVQDRGRFRDATGELGLETFVRDAYFVGAAFGDLDGDGYPELFLSSPVRGASVLLRNLEGRRFERSSRLADPGPGFHAAFVDLDHDGRLDLVRGGFADARTSTAAAVFGHGRGRWAGSTAIWLHESDGQLVRRPDLLGDDLPMGTMGAGIGDLDNDGCWDLYVGTGTPEPWFVLPNQMFRGRRAGRRCTGAMEEITAVGGFGSVQKGHGIVFFDADGDGDQDVYSALGGMWPGDAWPNQLFVNESETLGAWVGARLLGGDANRFALGARVTVRATAPDGEEILRRVRVDAGFGFGSAPLDARVGLLDANRVHSVEIRWPASGCRSRFPASLDTILVVQEPRCGQPARIGARRSPP